MGRGRGKGKKPTIVSYEDPVSGGEEVIPAYRRRGRPQKTPKDDVVEEESENIEEGDDVEVSTPSKEAKGLSLENGKKRKKRIQVKEKSDSISEENGTSISSVTEEPTKSNSFRQNGSRRKSKPQRAAEAGVECN